MQQNTQISQEKWEGQYVHSEVIGKSVWGEFREERQRDLTTGRAGEGGCSRSPRLLTRHRRQLWVLRPQPVLQGRQGEAAAEAGCAWDGPGMGLDGDVQPWRGQAWGSCTGEGGCGKEPRRPFLFQRDKKGRDVEGRVRMCFTGKSYTPRISRNGSWAQLRIGV